MKKSKFKEYLNEHGDEIFCGALGVVGVILGAGVMQHYCKKEWGIALFKWLSLNESNGMIKFFDPDTETQIDLASYLRLVEKHNF